MRWRAPSSIERRIGELVGAARLDARTGEIDIAWDRLGDAHVLAQPWALSHVRVHWTMLALGWRTQDAREVTGQAFRLVVAAPGSLTGRYPPGNSGRSDVSAFAAAPVRDDLAERLANAKDDDGDGSEVLAPSEVRTLADPMASYAAAGESDHEVVK